MGSGASLGSEGEEAGVEEGEGKRYSKAWVRIMFLSCEGGGLARGIRIE